mgnify:CR=1 FL=1
MDLDGASASEMVWRLRICAWLPPAKHERIVDRASSVIEQAGDQADSVAQVVQRRRISRRASQDNALFTLTDGFGEFGMIRHEFVPEVPDAKAAGNVRCRVQTV